MKGSTLIFTACLLLAIVVDGKTHFKRKMENSHKHEQRLDKLHKRAEEMIEDGHHQENLQPDEKRSNTHTNLPPKSREISEGEVNMLHKTHKNGRLVKAHKGRKMPKSHGRSIKKPPVIMRNSAKTKQLRKDLTGEVHTQSIRQAQKWLDDKQKAFRRTRQNEQQYATRHMQKVKDNLKLPHHSHHQKKESFPKHQNPNSRGGTMKHRNLDNRMNLNGRVHMGDRIQKDHTQFQKDKPRIKKTHRFNRDLKIGDQDAKRQSHQQIGV